MSKPKSSLELVGLHQYSGKLDAHSAATGMQAARLNAADLIATSQLLFDSQKFSHSVAFSILAIEETAKVSIILNIFLEVGDLKDMWKGFRSHTYKGSFLNPALASVAKSTFPEIDEETLKTIAEGPRPEDLDAHKQLGFYTDCFQSPDGPAWHLPKSLNATRTTARMWLGEAKALVNQLRDYPPEELEVRYKHAHHYDRKTKGELLTATKALRDELTEKGFIKAGSWDSIVKELERQANLDS